MGPETLINGDMLPVILKVRKLAGSEYIAGPIEVSGEVAFGVDIVDPANGGGTRLGVHSVKTTAGDVDIFEMRHVRISYDHDQDGVVAYHPFLLDQGRFLMQWRWPGNESEIFQHRPEDGRYRPTKESDTVTIEAQDFHANRATLTLPIVHAPDEPAAEPNGGNAESGTLEYHHFPTWLVVTAQFDGAESETPLLRTRGARIQEVSFRRIDDRTFRAGYVPGDDDVEVFLSVVHPRLEEEADQFFVVRRGIKASTLGMSEDVQITPGSESAYGTMFIRVDAVEATPGKTLHMTGPAYRLGHPRTPIDEPLDISFPLTVDASESARVHMYRLGRNRWEFQDTTRQDGRLQIRARRFGTYAAMQDDTPPRIRRIQPGPGQKTVGPRPTIRATIDDLGSDIEGFSATFNGQWLLMEYDPELASLTWEQDEDLPLGEGTVEFRVSDRAGNTAVERVKVEISGHAQ